MLQDLWSLFLSMASVGVFGYGGGPSVIPLIKKEAIDHHWMTAEEFTNALAFGNALPGPIATKMSAYIGYQVAGLPGALAGVLGMVVPSFILILALATAYLAVKDDPRARGALTAVRPVIVALLAYTTFDLLPKTGGVGMDYVVIALVAFGLMILPIVVPSLGFEIHPAIIIAVAAVFGIFYYAR